MVWYNISGDGRVNEFMGLTTQHTMWAREHNRVETKLYRLNPHWSGETLYEETRRIVSAMWQYIVYAEFLPVLLGKQTIARYGLGVEKQGYWNGGSHIL